MRKKLLIAENSGLFAEVERKNTELETFKIRLKEETELNEALKSENSALKEAVEELKKGLIAAGEEIERLKKEAAVITVSPAVEEKPQPVINELDEEPEVEEIPLSQTDNDIREVISGIESRNEVKPAEKPVVPELTTEQREKLRSLGAAAIGRVTKTTAYVVGELQSNPNDNTDRLYSLALGKNESFKIQVLALVESDGVFDDICEKLEDTADTATETIKSLVDRM